jgi:predicted SAM-dependent methyltransferase
MTKNILQREQFRSSILHKNPSKSILNRGKVRKLISSIIRNNPLQLIFIDKEKKYLNIGCGGNILKNFINIDYSWHPKQDICWNILNGLPFSKNSIEGIFTEHTLEHFTMQEICNTLLPEVFRVLVPNGIIRISIPDAEKAVERYVKIKAEGKVNIPFVEHESMRITPMMHLNDTFRQIYAPLQFGHKFAFDYQTLEYFLVNSGFVNVRREAYMQGSNDNLLVDYKRRAEESLYVEARKPGTK